MPVKQEIHTQRVPVKIWTDEVDERSKEQLTHIASLPFIHHHVAAMPDVHLGIGATIGSVIATHQAIIPAAVGVDIGCGMVAARLSLTANDLDEKALKRVFSQISRDVPVGGAQHQDSHALVEVVRPFEPRLKALTDKHPQLLKVFSKASKWVNQMGTLGGGNKICLDLVHIGARHGAWHLRHVFHQRQRRRCNQRPVARGQGLVNSVPRQPGRALAPGMPDLQCHLGAAVGMHEIDNLLPCTLLRIVPDAGAARRDAAIG